MSNLVLPEHERRQQAWSAYWASGALHSCAESYAGNYEGATAAFWREQFAALNANKSVLDLATGNGALPKLMLEQCGQDGLSRIEAVDLAQLAPDWHNPLMQPQLRFHAGVRMEQLPFPDASFDLIVSQYGFEYSDWPASLDEIARVLRPSGALALVIHHADSVIAHVAVEELAHQRLLLSEQGLLASAEAALPWLDRARKGDAQSLNSEQALNARQQYNLEMQNLAAAIAGSVTPDLLLQMREQIHGLVAGSYGTVLAEQQAKARGLRQALVDASLRTQEIIHCASDATRLEALVELIQQRMPQLDVTTQVLSEQQGIVGWAIRGQARCAIR